MTKVRTILCAAALSLASLVGCSSDESSSSGSGGAGTPPNFDTLQTTLTTPTGTFAAGTESNVADGFNKQSGAMTNGLSALDSGGSSTTQSFGGLALESL